MWSPICDYIELNKETNKIKVIFLDVDGVLNSLVQLEKARKNGEQKGLMIGTFDFHVEKLAEIVKETNAKIVMSSSWRIFYEDKVGSKFHTEITKRFEKFGLELFDKTPRRNDGLRGLEIKEWLEKNTNVDRFVILDDESFDIEYLYKKELVKTNFKEGLQNKHVKKAIKILNN